MELNVSGSSLPAEYLAPEFVRNLFSSASRNLLGSIVPWLVRRHCFFGQFVLRDRVGSASLPARDLLRQFPLEASLPWTISFEAFPFPDPSSAEHLVYYLIPLYSYLLHQPQRVTVVRFPVESASACTVIEPSSFLPLKRIFFGSAIDRVRAL